MELIRPLYLVRESDICAWRDYNDLHFLQCACHFTETCATCHEDEETSSKRLETKKLIAELKKNNPYIESNIFRSVENVNLDTVIAYKKNGKVFIRSGAGIVADSVPEREYVECINKARAVVTALEKAGEVEP